MTRHDTPFGMTRRSVLGGIGAIGIASAGAGLGTRAFYSDTETFADNALVAGSFDLKVDWQVTYDGPDGFVYVDAFPDAYTNDPADVSQVARNQYGDRITVPDDIRDPIFTREELAANLGTTVDDPQIESLFRTQFTDAPAEPVRPLVDLVDVKPGDSGTVDFSIHLFDNPGYLWLVGSLLENRENDVREPERADPNEDDVGPVPEDQVDDHGELADEILVTVWYDNDGDGVLDAEETVAFQDTLRAVLAAAESGVGIPLDADPTTEGRDCYPGLETRYVGVRWELPVDHANEVQTDSVAFDLGFYAEQCRHNDGSGQPPETAQ